MLTVHCWCTWWIGGAQYLCITCVINARWHFLTVAQLVRVVIAERMTASTNVHAYNVYCRYEVILEFTYSVHCWNVHVKCIVCTTGYWELSVEQNSYNAVNFAPVANEVHLWCTVRAHQVHQLLFAAWKSCGWLQFFGTTINRCRKTLRPGRIYIPKNCCQ